MRYTTVVTGLALPLLVGALAFQSPLGKPAPPLEVLVQSDILNPTTPKKHRFSLQPFRGKVILVSFITPYC